MWMKNKINHFIAGIKNKDEHHWRKSRIQKRRRLISILYD